MISNETGYNEELSAIRGVKVPVLDDGFVRLIDVMGDDSSIVQAARVSYGEGTKKLSEDRGLIRYLMRHRHTTPFEMCEIKLHVRVPMDCWRQWIRHRSASVNEYSTRYSIAIDAAQKTKPAEWRRQAASNKQGSEGYLDEEAGMQLTARESEIHHSCREVYEERLQAGVAREQARKDLPLSTYTEAYWKVDLHNLLHFLELRLEKNAQQEIRQYAEVIANEIVSKWVPLTWEAFLDYRMNSISLSKIEIDLLGTIHAEGMTKVVEDLKEMGWLKARNDSLKPNREAVEFADKLRLMKITAPWIAEFV